MVILETKNLTKVYGKGDTQVNALNGISLTVQRGEFVAVVGTSGSGKSTFLNMAGGLDVPTSGEVIVDGKRLDKLSEKELAVFRRRKTGFIFQQYNLIPMLNVYENIILPLKLDGRKADNSYVESITEALDLNSRLKSFPSQLSGGQQQRVAIARAIVTKPAVVLADEPTGNLDSNTSKEIMNLMQSVVREQNQTLIMVTHDNQLASFADRIIRIVDGKIVDMIDNTNKEQKSEKTEHKDNGQENNTVPENASDSVTMEERGGQSK